MSRAWLIENNGVVGVISHVRKAASQTEVTLVRETTSSSCCTTYQTCGQRVLAAVTLGLAQGYK